MSKEDKYKPIETEDEFEIKDSEEKVKKKLKIKNIKFDPSQINDVGAWLLWV